VQSPPALDNSLDSWQALRQRADLLGIPAWKLAEDMAYHENDGALRISSKKNKE
jgi:hypothetical protein|tara:strand:+ start:359 stop:520 length:162 start_codon:yes stop_codon:yes gene_type:complete